jgi:hypothetical protein
MHNMQVEAGSQPCAQETLDSSSRDSPDHSPQKIKSLNIQIRLNDSFFHQIILHNQWPHKQTYILTYICH